MSDIEQAQKTIRALKEASQAMSAAAEGINRMTISLAELGRVMWSWKYVHEAGAPYGETIEGFERWWAEQIASNSHE